MSRDGIDVRAATDRVAGIAVRTPLVPSEVLTAELGAPVFLKPEGLQPTGSFKVRGAASKIRALGSAEMRRGVVTASTGNHGRAVAHVARSLGVPATICLSVNVPPGKVGALESLGCRVVVGGDSQAEALIAAGELVDADGMTLVHPFDDPDVIAGQSTIGVEIAADAEDVSTVLVPLSGGGLAAGVAVALDGLRPGVRVIGVSMERAAVMATSIARGLPVEMPEESTLADSLQGGIGLDNRHTFALCRDLLDDVVLVTEDDIWRAMGVALRAHGLVLEGAGAVGIAAVLAGRVEADGPAVLVCSGANVEAADLTRLAETSD